MSYGLVGAYALYFILVGVHGNAGQMLTLVQRDGKNFLPWILAILILRALYSSETLRPAVKPFIALALLTFTLRNYGTIAAQLNQILPANVRLPTGK
jgi:hypothetical protein